MTSTDWSVLISVIKRSRDFSPKIYKSEWTIVKIVYLICRFTILTSWPLIAYIFVSDHAADNCSVWGYAQETIYLVLVSTVVQVILLDTSDFRRYSRFPLSVCLRRTKQ